MWDELVLNTPHCPGQVESLGNVMYNPELKAWCSGLSSIYRSNLHLINASVLKECKPETSYNKWHSSEIPFSILAWCLDALKQSVNQSCHDTMWHGSKQLLFSVSAHCWDVLTLQQRADLTCCNTLPHCQCSFCIPLFLLLYSECNKYWVCVKRALMVSVVHNFAIASYLWKKHVFFHIFFAAVLIFATMLQANGKFWFGDYG
jgi:hypothetical protein